MINDNIHQNIGVLFEREHTFDHLINNSQAVSRLCCGSDTCRAYFPNKTQPMESPRSHLIEFDQVCAQCRANLPAEL